MSKCCGIMGGILGHKFYLLWVEKISYPSNNTTLIITPELRLPIFKGLCSESLYNKMRKKFPEMKTLVSKYFCIRCGTEKEIN